MLLGAEPSNFSLLKLIVALLGRLLEGYLLIPPNDGRIHLESLLSSEITRIFFPVEWQPCYPCQSSYVRSSLYKRWARFLLYTAPPQRASVDAPQRHTA